MSAKKVWSFNYRLHGQWLLPLVFAVIAAIAFDRHWLNSLDLLLYDTGQRLRPATKSESPNSQASQQQKPSLSDIIIVAIDEQSIDALGRWPWSRSQHAQLIDQLAAYDVETIIFDVLFADASNPKEDAELVRAIKAQGKVVLPLSIEPLRNSGQLIEVLPIAELLEAASAIGHAHIECDYDGVCRSFYAREGIGKATWRHMSAASLPADTALPGHRAPVNVAPSPLWIFRDFHNYIPFSLADKLPIVSYIDVLEGRLPAHYFSGKTIFIGATAAGVHDILTTPIGRLPGVEISALIHHHLKAGTLIKRLDGALWSIAMGIGLLVLLGCLSLQAPRRFLWLSLLALAFQSTVAFALLIWANYWLAIAPIMLATLLFYPAWSWLRLELAMSYLKGALTSRQQHSPPKSNLLSSLSTPIPAPPWYMGNDMVTRTIAQLDHANTTQETAHQLLDQSVSGLQEGCIIFDESGQCYLANTLAKQWLPDWDDGNVNTLSQQLTIAIDDWPEAIRSVFEEKKTIQCEALHIHEFRSAANYFLQLKGCKIHLQGNNKEFTVGVLTLTDIGALKTSEQAREETLNFISHDLRSPLVSILSLIEHQRQEQKNNSHSQEETENIESDFLDQVERYAQRNLAYSESLLQLNRAEQLNPNQTHVCEFLAICEDAYEQVQPFAQSNDCELHLSWLNTTDGHNSGDHEDLWVHGDYELLQRAVVNLLTNAIKYGASKRGVVLHLEKSPQESLIKFSVQDFGVGMTGGQQAQAFARFSRAATPNSSGAGLGLYFVQTVIIKHGGTIQLSSAPGEGCCIHVSLPLQTLDFMDDIE